MDACRGLTEELVLPQLLPCENERSVEQHFMHSLKQVPVVDGGAVGVHAD